MPGRLTLGDWQLPTVTEIEKAPVSSMIKGNTLTLGDFKVNLVKAGQSGSLPYGLSFTPSGYAITGILNFFKKIDISDTTLQAYPERSIKDWLRQGDQIQFVFRSTCVFSLMTARLREDPRYDYEADLLCWKKILRNGADMTRTEVTKLNDLDIFGHTWRHMLTLSSTTDPQYIRIPPKWPLKQQSVIDEENRLKMKKAEDEAKESRCAIF